MQINISWRVEGSKRPRHPRHTRVRGAFSRKRKRLGLPCMAGAFTERGRQGTIVSGRFRTGNLVAHTFFWCHFDMQEAGLITHLLCPFSWNGTDSVHELNY